MILAIIVSTIMLLGCLLILWIIWDGVVCGAYDPPDYRCGRCQRCREELAHTTGHIHGFADSTNDLAAVAESENTP